MATLSDTGSAAQLQELSDDGSEDADFLKGLASHQMVVKLSFLLLCPPQRLLVL